MYNLEDTYKWQTKNVRHAVQAEMMRDGRKHCRHMPAMPLPLILPVLYTYVPFLNQTSISIEVRWCTHHVQ